MSEPLILISHHLCPYVQRAAISLDEKHVAFERIYVDLANKPPWFLDVSPLGKTPVLKVGNTAIFESAVILEYLEETQPNPLHPTDPLERAEHRSWIEYGSSLLNDIGTFYSATDQGRFENSTTTLSEKFARLETRSSGLPYFNGERFSLVDVAFGPVFRYFDVFDEIGDFGILADKPKLLAWRKALADRSSVKSAVTDDYHSRLWHFLEARDSILSEIMLAN